MNVSSRLKNQTEKNEMCVERNEDMKFRRDLTHFMPI